MRCTLVVLAIALTIACAPAPARRAPEEIVPSPDHWTSPADEAEGSLRQDWWADLDDPALDAIVLEALERNHDLRAAAARLEAAAAEAQIAGADLKPSVSLGLTGSRRKQNFIGLPIPGAAGRILTTTTTSYGVSVDTSWEADLWGKLRSRKAAAVSELEASRAELEAARLSIAGQTAKAWFALVEARRQLELAEATVGSYRDTVKRVRSRYEKGIRSSLDLRLTLSNLAAAEARLEQRRDLFQRAARQVELLAGRYPEGSIESGGSLRPPTAPVPAGLPSSLVARRPDLVAAEHRLAAADARVTGSKAALYPSLVLTGGGGTSTRELQDLLDGDFSVWNLAAGVLQPIFQGGRLRASVDLAESVASGTLEAYASAVLFAYAEVETALSSESILARQEEALAVAAEQAAAARKLAEDRYDAGLEDIVTVLDAQRRALDAESQLLAVRRSRLDTRVDLYMALGGGFDAGAPTRSTASDADDTRTEEPTS